MFYEVDCEFEDDADGGLLGIMVLGQERGKDNRGEWEQRGWYLDEEKHLRMMMNAPIVLLKISIDLYYSVDYN